MGEIIKFVEEDLIVDVNVENNNIWLNRKQLSLLYDRDIKTIGKHINNALKEELKNDDSVVAKFAITGSDGKTYNVDHYSLDMILSVGFRVKSKNGIVFRRWAMDILNKYLLDGYAINEKRLEVLIKKIEIQTKMLAHSMSVDVDDIDFVIKSYTNALSLLDDYDHRCVIRPIELSDNTYELTYDECKDVIGKMAHYGTTDVFGVEKEKGKFEGILAAVYQQGFGIEMYPSIEEKAANLLYFLVKDHPFADGCKRIAATLFVHFLNRNKFLFIDGKQIISNSTLVAITIMIAESSPKEKDIMVNLMMNILQERN